MAKNIVNESKVDIAYRLLSKSRSKKGKDFYDIWNDVKEEYMKLHPDTNPNELEEEISYFNTNLTLDSRFIYITKEGKWNLKERVSLEEIADTNVVIDLKADEESSENENGEDGTEERNDDSIDDYQNEDSFDDSTGSDANMKWNDEPEEEEEY